MYHSDVELHQYTDILGRPASPTFGGTYVLEIEPPPQGDATLYGWMVHPALFLNGQVLIKDLSTDTAFKVIKFFNAYCVGLEGLFDGTGSNGQSRSYRTRLTISPQAVEIGGHFHDTNWPAPEPIVNWDWTAMDAICNPKPVRKADPSAPNDVPRPALPTSKGVTDEEDQRPVDPSRTPDYPASTNPDRPTLNPSRTPDYPSADKPRLPTHADRMETIEQIVEWLGKDDEQGRIEKRNKEIRLATEEEKKRLEKIREEYKLTSNRKRDKNVAYAEGQITDKDGNVIDYDVVAVSGPKGVEGTVPAKKQEDQQLETSPTQGDIDANRGDKDRRAYDTEVKILEDILDKTNADSTGQVTILSERGVCPSCQRAALEQFKKLRPNIKIILVEAERPTIDDKLPDHN